MKTWVLALLFASFFLVLLGGASALAQSDVSRAADCSTYARNRADSESSAGSGALRGGVRGAAGGALFGAIIDGERGAGRGAALGGGVGAVRGGVRKSRRRDDLYRIYYDACMRGRI